MAANPAAKEVPAARGWRRMQPFSPTPADKTPPSGQRNLSPPRCRASARQVVNPSHWIVVPETDRTIRTRRTRVGAGDLDSGGEFGLDACCAGPHHDEGTTAKNVTTCSRKN